MVVEVKVRAFRDFATSLATQLVEQLCAEFEREVQYLYGDCAAYRGELGRVATLLSDQVQREKVLHEMMASMQLTMNAALGDSSRAEDMKSPLMAAEQELGRIMQLLSQPMIPEMAPKLTTPTGVPPVLPQAPSVTATSVGTSQSISPHIMTHTVQSAPNTPRSGGYSCTAPPVRVLPQSPGIGFPPPGQPPLQLAPPGPPAYHQPFPVVPPLVAAQGPTPGSVVVLPAAPVR
mmetsp:Transcript_11789/g.21469  ORF Transcript_11789/g.21469 Transcript_11789/m.21469 type:complete len:233 (+) Transcript_11789:42-740(+)